ncbi:orotate phosphoribosyltransferase [Paenibacillus sp. 1011MAR3C5]|uniref:orotate phosphoribosyltransferase n=1 Tax=Paenibacillus sp. 1011MAR3C5 TaxID=1675787 RepID=UPI000E6B6B5D|nr:orotate phosphoribosyltransferase [Paenibacillus sp. 1011MAR3C5]RJE90289.1 orotate phosphoribosyltransferase [Paenibacillus sp. 1011MAR3C5]
MTRSLEKQIYDTAHLSDTFTLRSGQISNEYFDKYLFEANPGVLHDIAVQLVSLIPDGTEVLAGLEMGGIPVVTALSLQSGVPVAFVRKKAKEYGTCKLAEGASISGRRVCVVEDVITTGGQVIMSTQELREAGAIVEDVICVIERNPEGRRKLEEIGVRVHALFKMEELLNARGEG